MHRRCDARAAGPGPGALDERRRAVREPRDLRRRPGRPAARRRLRRALPRPRLRQQHGRDRSLRGGAGQGPPAAARVARAGCGAERRRLTAGEGQCDGPSRALRRRARPAAPRSRGGRSPAGASSSRSASAPATGGSVPPPVTDDAGRVAATLRPGPSRRIRLVVASNDSTIGATSRTLRVAVPAEATIHVSRTALRNGETVRFSGRLLGGHVPRAGRELELQGFNPLKGRWQPVRTEGLRSDRHGRWHTAYRFTGDGRRDGDLPLQAARAAAVRPSVRRGTLADRQRDGPRVGGAGPQRRTPRRPEGRRAFARGCIVLYAASRSALTRSSVARRSSARCSRRCASAVLTPSLRPVCAAVCGCSPRRPKRSSMT